MAVRSQRDFMPDLFKKSDRPSVHSKRERSGLSSRTHLRFHAIRGWAIAIGAWCILLWSASFVLAQSPAPAPPAAPSAAPLRIATRLSKPDVFQENGEMVGFSVDIGRSLLAQLQRQAAIEVYPDVPDILNAVRTGQADLGIAAIALTSQREQEFDFSHPILSNELQIMVLDEGEAGVFRQLFTTLFSKNVLELLGIIAFLMLIPVHIVWYFERQNKELISNSSYIPGIFEALWWTLLTLLGQSGEMPKKPVARIAALFWVFVGIIFVTYFTAFITTELTVQELQGDIQSIQDLPNYHVALVANQEALDYLNDQNVDQITQFEQIEPAYAALQAREVDAIVAPRPLLLFYALRASNRQVRLVGAPFRDQFYAIVMPKNSPDRKPINQALLRLKEQGIYREVYQKWYGVNLDE